MFDWSAFATLSASAVALFIGVLGVFASLRGSDQNRQAGLELQYQGERTRALTRVVQLMESVGQSIEARIFNLTEARRGYDPVTGSEDNPYAPMPRPEIERKAADEIDIRALVGAYGDQEMDIALYRWVHELANIDRVFLETEIYYTEQQKRPTVMHFAAAHMNEISARTGLRHMIRETVRVAPAAPRRRPSPVRKSRQ